MTSNRSWRSRFTSTFCEIVSGEVLLPKGGGNPKRLWRVAEFYISELASDLCQLMRLYCSLCLINSSCFLFSSYSSCASAYLASSTC